MRAPPFWWVAPPTVAARLLAPLGRAVGAVAARRMDEAGVRSAVPVICVGNPVAGGAGKTPTVLALAAIARAQGLAPAVLTRGYGGSLAGPVEVDPARHRAAEVGDEALLHAAVAPTVVARDRVKGAALLARPGVDLLLLDDGFQNPSLAKDLSLLVVDAAAGVGNGLVLPAGPLRAPLAAQLAHADALVLIGRGRPGEAVAAAARRRGLQVLAARIEADQAVRPRLAGRRVLAYAGLGRPEKVIATLAALGAEVVDLIPFPDHHAYGDNDARALLGEARRRDAILATTAKDAVKLAGSAGLEALAAASVVVPVRLRFQDEEEVGKLVARTARRG